MSTRNRVDVDNVRQRSVWLPARLDVGSASLKTEERCLRYVEKIFCPRSAGKRECLGSCVHTEVCMSASV